MNRTVWQSVPTKRNGARSEFVVNANGVWYTRVRGYPGTAGKWIRFSISGRVPDVSKCIALDMDERLPGDTQ